ncbi:MAG: PilZ domain-containing protein [Gammaproteobacteria bacterium]|nr:PilZ domain-containing protein [Gammaproteobacteria bacterium]NIR83611.1 PilZ domain-containing protein [Gammaproteobacteria bacterium]NIR91584.1 PilZ domain-containing protein [Gammaproteobacteria bacterium]NIU04773.1 PilZ domain-containing protein [Gammaproteobacteria bacterium]NIV53123.1 hypothetical protein [Gammaproteobacteria bacterium]
MRSKKAQQKSERERRKSHRVRRDERVLVKIVSSSVEDLAGKIARCTTHDISQDGVCLQFEEPVPVGSTLDLRINVHDRSGAFILSGRVVWCREEGTNERVYAAGVEFQREGSDDLEAWRAMAGEDRPRPAKIERDVSRRRSRGEPV